MLGVQGNKGYEGKCKGCKGTWGARVGVRDARVLGMQRHKAARGLRTPTMRTPTMVSQNEEHSDVCRLLCALKCEKLT